MSVPCICVRELVKEFPRSNRLLQVFARSAGKDPIRALRGVTLELQAGKIHALIGPNGAGKTTLMKIIGGLMLPSAGEVLLDGKPIDGSARARQEIGFVVANERSFFWRLSLLQNLTFFAALQGVPVAARTRRVMDCLDAVGLEAACGQAYQGISTGMRQRLAIARGLLSEPRILLLDEATRSLDPAAALEVRALVKQLIEQDARRSILYSSHNLMELEDLCEHLFVLREGRIVADEALGPESRCAEQVYRFVLRSPLPAGLAQRLELRPSDEQGLVLQAAASDPQTIDALLDRLREAGVGIAEFGPLRHGMEERFFGPAPRKP